MTALCTSYVLASLGTTSTMTTAARSFAKYFIPIQSDPSVLNNLMYGLGVSISSFLAKLASIQDQVSLALALRSTLVIASS